jgi:hypothetical protein
MTTATVSKPSKPKSRPSLPDLSPYIERAVHFTEDMPYPGKYLVLHHESYAEHIAKFMATIGIEVPKLTNAEESAKGYGAFLRDKALPVGRYNLFQREIAPWAWRSRWMFGGPESYCWLKTTLQMQRQGKETGHVTFTGSVFIPILATSTEVWMSLTPMEILSQRAGLRKARGKVLVGGLGMGWFARRCLERKQVDSVTIVERDPAIISTFGGGLKHDFGNRVRFVTGDAFEAVRAHEYDSVLYDIWPGCGYSKDDRRWQAFIDGHPNTWAW